MQMPTPAQHWGDPHFETQQKSHPYPSGLSSGYPIRKNFSLNIFYKYKAPRWCITNVRNIEVPVLNSDLLSPQNRKSWIILQNPSSQEPNSNSSPSIPVMGVNHAAGEIASRVALHPTAVTSSLTRPALTHRNNNSTDCPEPHFRFLDLPPELRLKIYMLLLPPRTHKIATQIPSSGLFYSNISLPPPSNALQTFYHFGRNPAGPSQLLTTYTLLTKNSNKNFPHESIHTAILRVSRRVYEEAIGVLYGGRNVIFDFGIYWGSLEAFWRDRGEVARECVKNIKVAREIPALVERNEVDQRWVKLAGYMKESLPNVRVLDLTIWSGCGSLEGFPKANGNVKEETTGWNSGLRDVRRLELERRWKEWVWTGEMVGLEGLNEARITWWGFGRCGEVEEGKGFDSWVASRMAGDSVIREKMVGEGRVEEGFVVLRGGVGPADF